MAHCRDPDSCLSRHTHPYSTASHRTHKIALPWNPCRHQVPKTQSLKTMRVHGNSKMTPVEEPDPVSLLKRLIKDCGKLRNLHKSWDAHAAVIERGLFRMDLFLTTSLIGMYAKCGELEKARQVFEQLTPARDVVSWNAMISSYAHEKGLESEALSLFSHMQCEDLLPNVVTFSCILKACGFTGSVGLGKEIHNVIKKRGLLNHDVILGTSLVDMYAKCGFLDKARKVFDDLSVRNIVTWNALIAGYANNGCGKEAIDCYSELQEEIGILPNEVTFACLLKACGSERHIDKGEEIHAEISKRGLLKNNIVLGNTLVDMYVKCGLLTKAKEAFDELRRRDVVSWTTLLCGYAHHGLDNEALDCYARMRHEGIRPDAVTFCCILKSCGNKGAIEKGEEIHTEVRKQGLLLTKDVTLHTALVYMYAKCGFLLKAREVFDAIPIHDGIAWNALIAGYTQNGLSDKALDCFQQMQYNHLPLSPLTFASALSASGHIGSAKQGQEIHAEIIMRGLLKDNIALGNALVDMYVKCGFLTKAHEMFIMLPERNNLSWNALITGYAQHGHVMKVFYSFTKMVADGIVPNGVTFVLLLTACSYAGLVDEGQLCLDTMMAQYSLPPTLEHYTSLVDLWSRAGCFDKAIILISTIPTSDHRRLWQVLLGSCQRWFDLNVAKWAFDRWVELDHSDASGYVCMSNMYADASMQWEAHS